MITSDKQAEIDECPCDVCSSQDDQEKCLKRERELENRMDVLSNHIIDLIIQNPKKYLLKSEKEKS